MTHYAGVEMFTDKRFASARRFAAYLGGVVSAATAEPPGQAIATPISCRRRPGHKPCPGRLEVYRGVHPADIEWRCPACGDDGVISNWQGSRWDRSAPPFPAPETAESWVGDVLEISARPHREGHGIPEIAMVLVQEFCEERVPARFWDQARVEVEIGPQALTIVERRAPWPPLNPPGTPPGGLPGNLSPNPPGSQSREWTRKPVARLRYSPTTTLWTLYWPDQHGKFHRYRQLEPSASVSDLLVEIDRDPGSIFWG